MSDISTPRPIDLPTVVPLSPDAELTVLDEAKILAAPADPADRPAWRAALLRWRDEARVRVGYRPELYDAGVGGWAERCWNVAVVWLWDEVLWDWEQDRFDVERLLSAYGDVGGLDAVVLWHAYPVIGIDERNQFDWYTEVPGLAGLVAGLHDRGVRVFVDYNPWDVGTRRTECSDAERLASLVEETGADGIFLDTLKEGDAELLRTVAATTPRPVLEGESRVPLARVADQQASWAQWFADSDVPGVLRARWFEQRHMMHHVRRWDRDHRAELRSAWVNGAGVLVWDVVFGVRVDWSVRDRTTLASMRRVYGVLSELLLRGTWEPLADLHPAATRHGIAGSSWRLAGCTLFTLANPTTRAYDGPLLPEADGATVVVLGDGTVPAGGVAGVLQVAPGAEVPDGAAALAGPGPPATRSPAATRPAPVRVPAPRTTGTPAPDGIPVPVGGRTLALRWRQRETGLYESAAYVDDWKPLPPRLHQLREGTRTARLTGSVVDAHEVTDGEFAVFLHESGYRPRTAHRFLAHWPDGPGGGPAAGGGPVRFVDLDDARAYARWRGARLPTEDEWQVAAGEVGWRRGVPLVWQWTESEHRDGRTRWAILKGGSGYAAQGSPWYVDGGPRPDEWALRYLLTGGGTSRSACIGFRCAVDGNERTGAR